MSAAAHAVRPKAAPPAPETRRRAPAAETSLSRSPRYLRASLRLGGLDDPEEREAEHAAGVIAAGGSYRVRDPGGSGDVRPAVAPAVPDPGAEGRVRRNATHEAAAAETPQALRAVAASPVIDPGATGRVRRAAASRIIDPGGAGHLRAMQAAPDADAGGAVRRASPGPLPSMTSDGEAATRIERARAAAARPLPAMVRSRLEQGFGQPLDHVHVHTGPAARAAAAAIGARAYTEGDRITLGSGESEHDLRLMAHEATHVVQNRRLAGQMRPPAAEPAKMRAESLPAESGPIRRSVVSDALDWLADKANLIPGFRMFTIILGVNPINMSRVERSAANVLRAVIDFIPGGDLIVRALDRYGVFDRIGDWLDKQIASLGITWQAIKQAILDFIDSLGLGDVFHPGRVWDRAKLIFTEPIDRIIDFVKSLVSGIIDFLKDAILRPLAALAAKTRAWDLLIAVLGKNPITGDPVPQTAETLIGGFMKLIGQEAVWHNMQRAHAVSRAWSWFKGALSGLLGFVRQIPTLFIDALKSFKIADILDLPGAFLRVAGMFGNFVGRFISWAGNEVWTLLEIIFDVVSPGAWGYVKKTGAALKSILKNPLPFVGHLVRAAKHGFQNFADNFGTHLKAGLIDWLTGSLPGVYIPKAVSLPEFGKFALSVLGLGWAQIRGKIVKALGTNGETIMKGLETAFDAVVALVKGGAAAAWELVKDNLTNLKDMVIDGIIGFVGETIVKKAIPKLISLFIPGAGFISAILSIYDTVMVFVQKLSKIAAAIAAFIDSIVLIAAGQVEGAAKRVEAALGGLVSLAISFLAGFLGLGNIASKITDVIEKVRAVVDKALDTAIGWIIGKAKALFARLFGKKDDKTAADPNVQKRWNEGIEAVHALAIKLSSAPLPKQEVEQELNGIKVKYEFKELRLIEVRSRLRVHAVMNPEEDVELAGGDLDPAEFTGESLWIEVGRRVGADEIPIGAGAKLSAKSLSWNSTVLLRLIVRSGQSESDKAAARSVVAASLMKASNSTSEADIYRFVGEAARAVNRLYAAVVAATHGKQLQAHHRPGVAESSPTFATTRAGRKRASVAKRIAENVSNLTAEEKAIALRPKSQRPALIREYVAQLLETEIEQKTEAGAGPLEEFDLDIFTSEIHLGQIHNRE